MNDPERPPFDDHTLEEIKAAIHDVDERHWPLLIDLQVPNYHPLNKPVPPQRPVHFRDAVEAYAAALFAAEAHYHISFRTDFRYAPWLSRLANRTEKKVLDALDFIEQGNVTATLWYHGVTQPEIVDTIRKRLWHATNQYTQRIIEPQAAAYAKAGVDVSSASPLLLMAHAAHVAAKGTKTVPAKGKRLSALIHSPSAAAKMEAFRKSKGLNQTQFAIRAQTTDKTIRKFRQTGHIKPSILDGIAQVMGVTKDELLS